MAIIYKDWEIQNLQIWLAKIDNKRGLDFFIRDRLHFSMKKFHTEIQRYWPFFSKIISKIEVPKRPMR